MLKIEPHNQKFDSLSYSGTLCKKDSKLIKDQTKSDGEDINTPVS
jgi:hypothetical protein